MSFDFAAYLQTVDPDQQYEISILESTVNVTVRARRKIGGKSSLVPYAQSMILKYSPPYMAAKGKNSPLSTFRQILEARILALFHEDLNSILSTTSIAVPEVIKLDAKANILVLSDLGSCESLAEICSDLGGYNSTSKHNTEHECPRQLSPLLRLDLDYYKTIGTQFGSFFAKLHSPSTLDILLNSPKYGRQYLENTEILKSTSANDTGQVQAQLQQFPQLLTKLEESRELAELIQKDKERKPLPEEEALVLRDASLGSLLVSNRSKEDDPKNPFTAVVDWEFACLGRGISSDLPQLLAHIALFETSARFNHATDCSEALKTLGRSIISSYLIISQAEGAPWLTNTTTTAKNDASFPSSHMSYSEGIKVVILRSFLIIFATEYLRCAMWKIWICTSPQCGITSEDGSRRHSTEKKDCKLIHEMVKTAIWYLRATKESHAEFSRRWKDLLLDRDEGELEDRCLWVLELMKAVLKQ